MRKKRKIKRVKKIKNKEKIKKPKSFKENSLYLSLKDKIIQNNHLIPQIKNCSKNKLIKNTCFNNQILKDKSIENNILDDLIINETKENYGSSEIYKCYQIDIEFNDLQKTIMERWRKSYILMYNETIYFLKNNYKKTKEEFDNNIDYVDFKNNLNIYYHIEKELKEKNEIYDKIEITKENKNKRTEIKNIIKNFEKDLKNIKELLKKNTDNIKNYITKNNSIFSFTKGKYKLNYQNIRTYYIKNIKDQILEKSKLSEDFIKKYNVDKKINTCIYSHTLDKAIQLATSNYQSGLTNLERGNIKKFSIKYWNINKKYQLVDIEKQEFKEEKYLQNEKRQNFSSIFNLTKNNDHYYSMAKSKLGNIKFKYKNKEVLIDYINCDCKIYYDNDLNKYKLLIPEELKFYCEEDKCKILKNYISIDPGLRTFLTGMTNNEIIEIGINKNSKLDNYIKKMIKIESINKCNKKKHKLKTLRRKIKNYVSEMHWKSIDYLTNNYKNILLGDMSTKGIIRNETSKIDSYNKILASSIRLYEFREKLKYKCYLRGNNYFNIKENYTSKVCSCCGHYKKDLGSNKVYNCKNCNVKMDRDINGCINILIKSI
jgi:transposase